ncbi:MAG TPA: M4 family metallopeptidase [Bacteroidales bacterium]|nr:M4 family metallopeptidase [Bacteroidales bacterium]
MKKILLLLIISLSIPVVACSQIYQGDAARKFIKGSEMVRYADKSANPCYIRYSPDEQPLFSDLDNWMKRTFNTASSMNFILTGTEKDDLGFTHYRYRQTQHGIPVHEAVFIVHVFNDKIQSFNGTVYSDISINNAYNISDETALSNALAYINASEYKWQKSSEESWLKEFTNDPDATFFPKAIKEIIYSEQDNAFRVAYNFDIYASKPVSRQNIYVDAQSGKIIKSLETLHKTDVSGTAATKYSGNRIITTDSMSPAAFRLRENGRGDGIITYNMQQQTDYASAVDFTDADNHWNNVNAQLDEAATDAHWATEMTYDYYLINHSRNSLDNNGFALYSYIHYDQAYGNAFWNGLCMTYGDGENNNPFCALDICAHEMTHGLDEYTANLDYADESGAMNEGFSDVFGTAVEFYAKPAQANWTCGENIGIVIRNLQDPNLSGNPDTYLGDYWDFAQEVHANSTVLSHWYYLICQGGSGTNDNNDAYSVTGIGMDKASDIAFRMLTVYLTNTSDYMDSRFYAIISASDLYGFCSPEVASVTNAMYAVGIGDAYSPNVSVGFIASGTQSCSVPLTVQFENQTVNANNYLWHFGDGTTSTQINPSHTYNIPGTYNVKLVASSAGCGSDSLTQTGFVSIAATNSNYAVMPASGTGQALTCCTGTLFDSGETGNYSNNSDGSITIAPTGASNVVLNFSSFDFESGYDYLYIYDGPNSSSPLIGMYDGNNLPGGGTIQSTYGSITLRQFTDQGLVKPGFELSWHCNILEMPPVANFSASELATCNGVVHFQDMSFNGPLTWHWDFGDGDTSNLQNPVHAYQANGTYTVILTAANNYGDSTKVRTDYIVVQDLPPIPAITPGSACDSNSVTLTAAGSGQLDWYNMQTGGTLLYTGSTFITPVLYQTTTYYVEQAIIPPLEYVGKTSKSNDATLHNNNGYSLIFDCFTPMILKSVKVYAGDAKDRIVVLRDSVGNILQTMNAFVPAGESRITLNFDIPAGNNMTLGCGTEDPNMYRDISGISFPYDLAGKISITGTNAAPNIRYYYYYDWEVQERPCTSPRVPVVATIYDCNGVEEPESIINFNVYPNPAENEFFIEFSSTEPEDCSITVFDVLGKEVLSQKLIAGMGLNTQKIDCSKFESGLYFLHFTGRSFDKMQKIVIY